jgi:ABC-type glycerol-3-phosphate transport system substrate-binding protein
MRTSRFFYSLAPLIILVFAGFSSCFLRTEKRLILWTDCPEFALYAEYFNTAQDKYKVEVRYFESTAQKLTEAGEYPDIAAASWLRNTSIRAYFRSLESTMSKNGIQKSSFYPRLLSLGNVDGRQYLLPVSFNIPAIVFVRDFNQNSSNPFVIEMGEIKERGKTFNTAAGGVYTRMGFSPSANDEFLFAAVNLFGASFREASPIAWDSHALEQGLSWLRSWIAGSNTGIQAEDDFAFKYFYDPPDKLLNSGRILYSYMDSSHFFTLPEERRMNLDFSWIAAAEKIPLDEGNVFYGIHKKTRAFKAAKAFTRWFFSAETQRLLLEAGKSKRITKSFGIAGGFSAMKTVTEQVFPHFYPDLLGRIPPENYLSPGNILPRNWMTIKRRVILPYLKERIRHESREEVRPLEKRINDWYRLNRD